MDFHKTVAQYLDKALPESCWWSTFPSGGGGKARGAKLKACGLKAGVPDILILFPTPEDSAVIATDILWLELKAPKGSLSDAQEAFVERMERFETVAVATCKTLNDVYEALVGSGIRPSARPA
ncbi:MAG TPA: VRR-NUC domain-containing protein [Salinarimonas sp.]|nr:VRR-NUC domain-containing protein [Salinarimonas sp.]